jgi:meso-butanediol dehydrogenase / (S,S)-butanediol dehydrogenase / diacetyl reductase
MSRTETAVVTGASGTIGRALVKRFADRGVNVVLVDRVVDDLTVFGKSAGLDEDSMLVIQADVSDDLSVRNYVDATVAKFGRIDYLANHAGIEAHNGLIEDQPIEHLDEAYAVNVRSVFLGMHYVLPVMKAQGSGAIVNTASLSSLRATAGRAPYTMSKHAVIGLTRSAAVETAAAGIRVNAVLPGPTDTAMLARSIAKLGVPADEARAAAQKAIPMGRYGTADEVAAVMSFLLSKDASFVTNSMYTVDGGVVQE